MTNRPSDWFASAASPNEEEPLLRLWVEAGSVPISGPIQPGTGALKFSALTPAELARLVRAAEPRAIQALCLALEHMAHIEVNEHGRLVVVIVGLSRESLIELGMAAYEAKCAIHELTTLGWIAAYRPPGTTGLYRGLSRRALNPTLFGLDGTPAGELDNRWETNRTNRPPAGQSTTATSADSSTTPVDESAFPLLTRTVRNSTSPEPDHLTALSTGTLDQPAHDTPRRGNTLLTRSVRPTDSPPNPQTRTVVTSSFSSSTTTDLSPDSSTTDPHGVVSEWMSDRVRIAANNAAPTTVTALAQCLTNPGNARRALTYFGITTPTGAEQTILTQLVLDWLACPHESAPAKAAPILAKIPPRKLQPDMPEREFLTRMAIACVTQATSTKAMQSVGYFITAIGTRWGETKGMRTFIDLLTAPDEPTLTPAMDKQTNLLWPETTLKEAFDVIEEAHLRGQADSARFNPYMSADLALMRKRPELQIGLIDLAERLSANTQTPWTRPNANWVTPPDPPPNPF